MDLVNLKKQLINSSYPMLGADKGEYIGAEQELSISDMDSNYLESAYNYLKSKEKIVTTREVGFKGIKDTEIIKLYYDKLSELKEELAKR